MVKGKEIVIIMPITTHAFEAVARFKFDYLLCSFYLNTLPISMQDVHLASLLLGTHVNTGNRSTEQVTKWSVRSVYFANSFVLDCWVHAWSFLLLDIQQ